MMKSAPDPTVIGDYVDEITDRLRGDAATVYSVTNEVGFVRSLDLFDKQVFSADIANYKKVGFKDLAYNPSRINVGSIGLCHDPKGGAVSPMYVVLHCRPALLPEFLLYFLKSDIGRREILHRCHGAVRSQLRFKDLCSIPLSVPSLDEQRRIVALLGEVDDLRDLCRRSGSRVADFGAALFFEMFGDPSNPGDRWAPTTLGALGRMVTGNTPPRANPRYYGAAIEWIKTDNIDPLRGAILSAAEHLSEEGIKVGRIVPRSTVLVTCIAGSRDRIGDAAVVDREVAINQQINAITPSSANNPMFVCAQVTALRPIIQHRTTGVMTKLISKSGLSGVPAIQPPLDLQDEFAARLREAQALAVLQTTRASLINDLAQSMMHQAYSGTLRAAH